MIDYSDHDFGSAAWYLTSQCDKDVVSGLSKPGTANFDAYLGCIGATGSAQRTEYYTNALKAFGVAEVVGGKYPGRSIEI